LQYFPIGFQVAHGHCARVVGYMSLLRSADSIRE